MKITNSGELDHRAMTLMGASDKRGDGEAIGFFGSGNKYALACLLRNNLTVKIFSGETEITVEVRNTEFRSKTFGVIWINGEATSITTETGPKWKVMDAVREFWSNALDEGEAERNFIETVSGDSSLYGLPGITTIYIQSCPEINFMFSDWDKYFIDPEKLPVHKGKHGSLYLAEQTGKISNYFRRGVWCAQERNEEPLFSYSFNEINLPESRLVSSFVGMREIARVLGDCDNPKVVKALLSNVTGTLPAEWKSMEYVYNSMAEKFYKTLVEVMAESGFQYVGGIQDRERVSSEDRAKTLWCEYIPLRVIERTSVPNVMNKAEYKKGYQVIGWPIGVYD
ncbi:MAG: hypothetical protein HOO86_09935, partial [Bacteroidales bacterium]|nr:hypothetical protein [Bacteroidales bacterium]